MLHTIFGGFIGFVIITLMVSGSKKFLSGFNGANGDLPALVFYIFGIGIGGGIGFLYDISYLLNIIS